VGNAIPYRQHEKPRRLISWNRNCSVCLPCFGFEFHVENHSLKQYQPDFGSTTTTSGTNGGAVNLDVAMQLDTQGAAATIEYNDVS
jgi:hypothetical protein